MNRQAAIIQKLLRPLAGIALRWYYREVSVAGAERIPLSGPLFIAVNHPNALIDALVIGTTVTRPVHFLAKATLFSNPVAATLLSGAGVIPLRRASDERVSEGVGNTVAAESDPTRNAASFGVVADALAANGVIVIFPEGRSHDDPYMAPLRTGLARMALMARDERSVPNIKIVPIGLLFEQKEEPRSRVLVQVGEALEVDTVPESPDAVSVLTEIVKSRLHSVTVNFESADDALRIRRAANTLSALVAPLGTIDNSGATLRDTLTMIRRADRVNRVIKERNDSELTSRVLAAEQRLERFRERLEQERILAEDLEIDLGTNAGSRLVVREFLFALFWYPLSLWGRLTHIVPIRITRALALKSVESKDQPAMRTVAIGFVLVMVAYTIEAFAVYTIGGAKWALLFILSLVPSASSDFRYGDRLRRLRARARTYLRFRKDPALRASLLAEAEWLRREAGAIEQIAAGK